MNDKNPDDSKEFLYWRTELGVCSDTTSTSSSEHRAMMPSVSSQRVATAAAAAAAGTSQREVATFSSRLALKREVVDDISTKSLDQVAADISYKNKSKNQPIDAFDSCFLRLMRNGDLVFDCIIFIDEFNYISQHITIHREKKDLTSVIQFTEETNISGKIVPLWKMPLKMGLRDGKYFIEVPYPQYYNILKLFEQLLNYVLSKDPELGKSTFSIIRKTEDSAGKLKYLKYKIKYLQLKNNF